MSDVLQIRALRNVFESIADPRMARGVRHPFSGILGLVFIGLVCRIREFATLQAWAQTHWSLLAEPLGFDRPRPPHATTISRTLGRFSVGEFQTAFSDWLLTLASQEDLSVAAVDGKTAKQGHEDGSPIHMLNVFAQKARVVLGQWSVTGDKTNEAGELKLRLEELLEEFPMIELLTGDAIFASRPLAELFSDTNCDYLFQVKKNQGDLLDAAETCFANKGQPHAEQIDQPQHKKGGASKLVAFGATPTTPTTAANDSISPTADCCSVWSVWSLSTGGKLFVM